MLEKFLLEKNVIEIFILWNVYFIFLSVVGNLYKHFEFPTYAIVVALTFFWWLVPARCNLKGRSPLSIILHMSHLN